MGPAGGMGGPPGGMGGGPPGGSPSEGSPYSGYPPNTLLTAYFYRAGQRHNEGPRQPLCSDHETRHNGRANVLFSDGSLRTVPEGPWRQLGFRTAKEIVTPPPPTGAIGPGYPGGKGGGQ